MKKSLLSAVVLSALWMSCNTMRQPRCCVRCMQQELSTRTPYWAETNTTEMVIVNSKVTETDKLRYVVVAALDTSHSAHLLITPRKFADSCEQAESIDWRYRLGTSTSLPLDQAKALGDSLNKVASEWSMGDIIREDTVMAFKYELTPHHSFRERNSLEDTDSTGFIGSSRNEIHELDMNVWFKGGKADSPVGQLVIGDEPVAIFDEKQDVQKFSRLIDIGVQQLEKMMSD